MTRIYTTTHINQPIEQVYEFATTPGNWPLWHPSSLGVEGDTDHSLAVGESCTEAFHVAGRKGQVVWTVTEREVPRRWTISGIIVGRNDGGIITYSLTPENGGTRFEREFVYPTPNLLFRLLNWLIIRRRVTAESEKALHQLKQVLEMR
jgi:uncharacterized protein YndB with AHSA1/START domain